jgi:hypothetical protein
MITPEGGFDGTGGHYNPIPNYGEMSNKYAPFLQVHIIVSSIY